MPTPNPFTAFLQRLAQSQNAAPAAAAATRSAPANAPSASEVSRALASAARREVYTISQDDVIEVAFGHLEIVSGLLYCCGGVDNGVLADALGTMYLGRTPQHLTEVRAVGDQNTPVLISETATSELQPARTCVRGKAGDKVILIFRA